MILVLIRTLRPFAFKEYLDQQFLLLLDIPFSDGGKNYDCLQMFLNYATYWGGRFPITLPNLLIIFY